MDNDGRKSSTSDQHQKERFISLAASSMINAADVINQEAYQANLKRIQEVKEMVRRLELNNETAHKNFLVDQLEKRAKDGREEEIMLTQFRNPARLPESIQLTNNVPTDKPEVILPTTATLVEVPETHASSYPSVPTIPSAPQTMQQGRPAEYRWMPPPQANKVQPYTQGVFPYYASSSIPHQPIQRSETSASQAPINGQMSWYTTQNAPPQPVVQGPPANQPGSHFIQAQPPPQPWNGYHPVVALPAANVVPTAGQYGFPAGWTWAKPASFAPGTTSATYRDSRFPTQSTMSRPVVATQNQPQTFSSIVSASQVEAPLHGIPTTHAKIFSGQIPYGGTRSGPIESQSQPLSIPISKPVSISELQWHHNLPQQQQQPLQHQPRKPPQHPQDHQRHSQQSQHQLQVPPQPSLPLLQPHRQPQQPSTHLQTLSHSADPMPSTSVSRRSSHVHHSPPVNTSPVIPQGSQPHVDQAMFIRDFQIALQRGALQLKIFLFQARASGVSDEWFRIAINSLPRHIWESVVAQINKSEATLDASATDVIQQQVSTAPSQNVAVHSAYQAGPVAQQVAKPNTLVEGGTTFTAPEQTSGAYVEELQHYAGQAAKSALSAQVSSTSAIPSARNLGEQGTVATPTRDIRNSQLNVRTPKDANKSTLARDILRSLGKAIPKPYQDIGGKPIDRADDHQGDQLPAANLAQPVTHIALPEPPLARNFVHANPSSIPSTKPSAEAELQHTVPADQSTTGPLLKEQHKLAATIEGPIMIDLTLEDSDGATDGKRQEAETTFPIQTFDNATILSPQPVSPTSVINRTPVQETLSLEDPPIHAAADRDNTDVRMCSPRSSLAVKEKIGSEPFHSPLGNMTAASPNPEPLPREASELPLDGGLLPLFLPSPPASPAHTSVPEVDLETTDAGERNKPFLKRHSVDVDEMEIDAEPLTPPHVRKRRKRQAYVLIPPAPPYVKEVLKKMKERARKDIGSDSEEIVAEEEFQYSHLEQLLTEESKLRLLERRCRWLNCTAVLNCATSLLAHLKSHANEEGSQAPFLCRWASCGRKFGVEQERDVHFERHTTRPLPCPFAGCDEQFNRPVEVMQHEVQHQKTENKEPLVHKPAYQPIVPAIPTRLGQPPHRLPSHRVIPRRVAKCRISADRHATLGPWILWNIFSPVDLNTRKQNASMRARPTRPAMENEMHNSDTQCNDYDFLLALSSHPAKSVQLDDLDSTLITTSAARGMTLWGSGAAVSRETGGATVLDSAAEEMVVERKSDSGSDVSVADSECSRPNDRSSGLMGEEDAVEEMLII